MLMENLSTRRELEIIVRRDLNQICSIYRTVGDAFFDEAADRLCQKIANSIHSNFLSNKKLTRKETKDMNKRFTQEVMDMFQALMDAKRHTLFPNNLEKMRKLIGALHHLELSDTADFNVKRADLNDPNSLRLRLRSEKALIAVQAVLKAHSAD